MLLLIAFQLAVVIRVKAPLALLISLGWLIFKVNAGISILAFNGFLETQWLLAYPIGLIDMGRLDHLEISKKSGDLSSHRLTGTQI